MTDSIEDFKNSDEYKEYEKRMNKKEKYLKKGPNVIHLQYLWSLFEESDFIEYENKLNGVGLELSRFDKSGVKLMSCLRLKK